MRTLIFILEALRWFLFWCFNKIFEYLNGQALTAQLFARLSSHPETKVRKQLEALLMSLANVSPWAIVYPTLVDLNACEGQPSEELHRLLSCLVRNHLLPCQFRDVVSLSWFHVFIWLIFCLCICQAKAECIMTCKLSLAGEPTSQTCEGCPSHDWRARCNHSSLG